VFIRIWDQRNIGLRTHLQWPMMVGILKTIKWFFSDSYNHLIETFICAHTHTNIFSQGSSESTLDERYLFDFNDE